MSLSYKERFCSSFPTSAAPSGDARLSENAMWLLDQRYFARRYDPSTGNVRKEATFEEFARRVARIVTSAETLYLSGGEGDLEWLRRLEGNIYEDILNRRFLFNSPCLFGTGAGMTVDPELSGKIYGEPESMSFEDYDILRRSKTKSQQLFACFVINVPDSIDGIFDGVKDAAVISKYGGGVGGNFGHLREKGSAINGGIGGQASGPVSFMETWNTMGAVVVQGGRRRAALMGMLFDDHPDIFEFIDAKVEEGKLPYFNISVCVSDKLMDSAENGTDFSLLSRSTGEAIRTVKAADLWNKLCESAWKRGDPGIFFIDRANADNLLKLGETWKIESTNPCGEQPLPNYTSCNLGSVNVEAFVSAGKDGRKVFDFRAFVDQVFRSVYYLDLVIDACSYPLERIEERTKRIRPVGLGIMGLADAAIKMGMRYGSEQFKVFCKSLGDSMGAAALCAAAGIVSEMGKDPFPESGLVAELFSAFAREQGEELFPESWYGRLDREGLRLLLDKMRSSSTMPYTLANSIESFASAEGLGDEKERLSLAGSILLAFSKGRIRNSRRLSIAPTGSISMLIDTSAGIEPNFAWSWTRRIARADGDGQETREFCHRLLSDAQVAELHEFGKVSDPVYVTAYDISPEEHVEVTGIFAGIVDSGISKTVNLPSSATMEEVKQIYRRCYAMGAKGITIYRDGSRSLQPIETAKKAEEQVPHTSRVKERPGLVVFGKTIKEQTPWGSIYVTLNFDGTEPFEVFATIGKSGSELKAMTEALSRAISIGLRSGGKLEDFIATLKGLSGKEYWLFEFDDEHVARSIPDAIAVLLEKLLGKDGAVHGAGGGAVCPECGSPLEMISGCEYCFSCGYSPCK
ncbi:MAG: adenosylcobalamin-dependent ribonucleoside-diphosphate reductase [Synergistaceae bacterium]|nr:adenosylcobalamin-dependent ribonucleoside-diphosphate reductase [Synergistaceae bacterium]MDD4020305.1 adenosylcobalamin-dependent ribonucleoside-diphosphate reductase [Synergistaceae bacterium]